MTIKITFNTERAPVIVPHIRLLEVDSAYIYVTFRFAFLNKEIFVKNEVSGIEVVAL